MRVLGLALLVLAVAGCGGDDNNPTYSITYSVGGTIAGLATGASVTLTNNGADALTVDANGPFVFPTPLKPGASYLVAVATLPTGEQCGVSGASGSVTGNVTSVQLTCAVPTLQLVAGALGGSGNVDGDRTTARFHSPQDVVPDAAGNLYVADQMNATIRKITPAGVVTTVAGSAGQLGTADGVGAAARFYYPSSLAVDPAGNIYVNDSVANTIREISPTGVVTTLAGTPFNPGFDDGTGPVAQFFGPNTIRWNSMGSLYLTDWYRIRNITTTGVVTTPYGVPDMTATLLGMAVDSTGVIVTEDTDDPQRNGFTRTVDSINLGTGISTLMGNYFFAEPAGVGLAPGSSPLAGTLYVVDTGAAVIWAIANGIDSVLAGENNEPAYLDGTGQAARFYLPANMSVDATGNLLVADAGNGCIRQVTPGGVVTTMAGVGPQPGYVDATGAAARFSTPQAVASDASGNVYVSDANALREVTQEGVVTTAHLAGGGSTGFALDSAGNVYGAATSLDIIGKIAADGTQSVIAGSSFTPGFANGTGTAALFDLPNGVAIDAAGNLFVADTGNHAIRMITPAGVVTTIAGVSGAIGTDDGPAATATFTAPFALVLDSEDNLFITDGNAIRKLSAVGIVSTVAGSQGPGSSDGSGSAAHFNGPAGIAVGPAGSLFVADSKNHTIRKITSDGTVTTIAGIAGKAGVTLGPLPTTLNAPFGLTYVGSTLYVTDPAENSLLAVTGQF
jgi:sugar lactone lactonase YvrE